MKGLDRYYKFRYLYTIIKTAVFYKFFFKKIGFKTCIFNPLKIHGSRNISLGDRVIIESNTWISAVPLTGNNASLFIDDGAQIGHFNHIYSTSNIYIGKNVLIADKVYITDNLHEYTNIYKPIMNQPIKQLSEVNIGDGSWLGENVCVIGASIGKNCVIGSNSVVTKDIPDFCVAVGIPAKVIKKYNFVTKIWEKVL